jgi:hypothetical protein
MYCSAIGPTTYIVGASALPELGIPLGVLIGILSGLLALSFLRTLQVVRKDSRKVGSMLAQVAGIPTLWFTVPFGSKLLTTVAPERLMTSYVITLAAVFACILAVPLIRLIIATAGEIRAGGTDG